LTPTPTTTPTNTPTSSLTPTPSVTTTNTPTQTPTTTPTNTPTNTVTPTPSITPSSSVTPTVTPTNTVTPTQTATPTNTPPAGSPTSTPTNTPTPTVTPSEAGIAPAYLIIEPDSIAPSIGTYMFNEGASWYGFGNGSGPIGAGDVSTYLDFYNLSGGTGGVPSVITQTIPQTGGGTDSEGNAIVQYNFLTTEISAGTITGNAWYSWLIPDESIGGAGSGNRQISIDLSFGQGPNTFVTETMSPTYYAYFISNPGGTFAPGTYRLYTTYQSTPFYRDNTSTTMYFKGNTVS